MTSGEDVPRRTPLEAVPKQSGSSTPSQADGQIGLPGAHGYQYGQINDDEAPAKTVDKTCPVWEKSFGLAEGGENGAPKGFVCLFDDCYASEGRRVWSIWGSFWNHQVDSGNLLFFHSNRLSQLLSKERKQDRQD